MTEPFDQDLSEVWLEKYGSRPPEGAPELGGILTHRSVRHYRSDPIPESTIATLMAAAQSASTSSNLQLWTAISVQEPQRRETIAQLCGNQRHILEAAWFFGFFADHHRIRQAAREAGTSPDGLDFEEFYVMAIVDASLAAERMVCAAESIGIGCCYIGALRNDVHGVQAFFNLPSGTFGVFGLCLGWPSVPLHEQIKPKLGQSAVWHRESYRDDVAEDIRSYEERMARHYVERGMDPSIPWSARMGRRTDGSEKSLTGREAIQAWVREQGFGRR